MRSLITKVCVGRLRDVLYLFSLPKTSFIVIRVYILSASDVETVLAELKSLRGHSYYSDRCFRLEAMILQTGQTQISLNIAVCVTSCHAKRLLPLSPRRCVVMSHLSGRLLNSASTLVCQMLRAVFHDLVDRDLANPGHNPCVPDAATCFTRAA